MNACNDAKCEKLSSVWVTLRYALLAPQFRKGLNILSESKWNHHGTGFTSMPYAGTTHEPHFMFPPQTFDGVNLSSVHELPPDFRFFALQPQPNGLHTVTFVRDEYIEANSIVRYSWNTGELYNERDELPGMVQQRSRLGMSVFLSSRRTR